MTMEFQGKVGRLRAFMREQGLGALVLGRQENFAWLTGGARGFVNMASEASVAWIVVTEDQAAVVTNAIEAPRMEDEELGLPLKVLAHPWHDDAARLARVQAITGGQPLASDLPLPGATPVNLAPLRWTLSSYEIERLRPAARAAAEALEAAAREISPGQSEFEIAAGLARHIIALGMEPVVNLVATDERVYQYRHPLPTDRRLERYAMLVIGARHRGLVISATRLVHFGPLPDHLGPRLEAVARVDAAMIAATQPGNRVATVWDQAVGAYTAAGYPGEWERHHQGGLAGYLSREYRAMPDSPQIIGANQLFAWNPSIAGVKSEDTILAVEGGPEILTATSDWPVVAVEAGGRTWHRPAILQRRHLF
ncbi:MAG: M24 family metallopeptidase [Bacillota bacterium]